MFKLALKLLAISACYLFFACDSYPSVTPAYVIDSAVPIAMKSEPPEVFLGETATLSLLVGGRDFSQKSDMAIKWLGNDSFSLPYGAPFSLVLPEKVELLLENVKEDPLVASYLESFDKRGYIDFPASASFDLEIPKSDKSRRITTTKIVRIFKRNENLVLRQNPLLKSISATYILDGERAQSSIKSGDKLVLPFKRTGDVVLFQSICKTDEESASHRLNYSWFFTKDVDFKSESGLKTTDDVDFFSGEAPISPYREYFAVDFSDIFQEIEADSLELPLVFNFYHAVRDKSKNGADIGDYRFGQDFLWFQLEISD